MTEAPPPQPKSRLIDVPALLKLLDQQLQLYRQLGALSQHQGQLLDQSAVDKLLAVLSERQKLIEALTRVGGAIDPYRQTLSGVWSSLPETDRNAIAQRLDQIQALVKDILDQDGRDRGILESARNRIGTELKQLASASKAASAYTAVSRSAGAQFADKQV